MKQYKRNISNSIVKAMGIFGGVQALNILCAIVRTKLVAVWIGPAGIGLFGLFNNAAEMIFSITSLGIRNSSVRDMAIAAESRSKERINQTITVIKRWSWFISLLGAVTTISLAPLLSRYTFGDNRHTWDFILLSTVLLFNGIANGEQAILQGTSALRRLAHASVWGVFFGLLVSIPLFYFLREKSIVPSIIAYAAMLLLFSWLFRHKDYSPAKMTGKETYQKGKEFAKLGIFMTVSGFVGSLFAYVFSAYLNRTAGTEEVGFYQAGFTLINKYVGLIFTAIGMEYYPRLASIQSSKMRIHAFVSQEVNMAVLVLLPIICIFLIARELIVSLLYSPNFHAIIPLISWAIIGTVFRAYSWCMAFVLLAKGDGKTYLCVETASAVTGFILNVVFYHCWGLTGLGISYIVWYAFYCVIVGTVYFRHYRLTISKGATLLTAAAFLLTVATLALLENDQLICAILTTAIITGGCFLKIHKSLTR